MAMVDPVVPIVPTTRVQFASPYAKIVTHEGHQGQREHHDREPHDHVEIHGEELETVEPVVQEADERPDQPHIDLAA